ncbi:MAG TPA: pilus assembly protein TadG-related protein [Gaiellales bacterium]|jgi:Putative Flp pilus-assembly TadE/G-like|nr:pilus assembly protein TadG-related protein [Gaiellales bacterium]
MLREHHPHSRGRVVSQRGQTLPLICLFMVSLLGVSGMVLDLGNGYVQRRAVQNEADAAAVAGADAIPSGNVTSAATQMAAKNGRSGDAVTVALSGNDTVTVTVRRTAPTFFLRVFGRSSLPVSATAVARIEALGAVKGHVSPYAVTVDAYANGTGTTLFKENQPGAYGTIDLPTTDNTSGGSCTGNTNKGTPSNIAPELSDNLAAGTLVIGGCLSVKSGASQPSANIVNNIPPNNNQMSQDLQSLGNGQYQVIPQSWDDPNGLPPRLMYIPIVQTLPSGNGTTNILSFAWFYMTSATGGGSGLTINGQWVTLQLPPTGETVQYQPGVIGQVLTSELVG